MKFYDLSKEERKEFVSNMKSELVIDFKSQKFDKFLEYGQDEDTYIRKNCYLNIARIYSEESNLRNIISSLLKREIKNSNELVRQTIVYTVGEIGRKIPKDFDNIKIIFDLGIFDASYRVQNAVVGALKRFGEKQPTIMLDYVNSHLTIDNSKLRAKLIHGMELRGRTHPEDVLPVLEKMQHDHSLAVQKKIIHVLGQISYKKGCLTKVLNNLKHWENIDLVKKAIEEIKQVHLNYINFADISPEKVEISLKSFLNELFV